MQESPELEISAELLERVRTIPAFHTFEESNLIDMLRLCRVVKYDADEMIMAEGTFDYWIHFLLAGRVRVQKGGSVISRIDSYGEMFGEMSVVGGFERTASVYADTDAVTLVLDGSIIDRIEPERQDAFYAVLYKFFAEVLANRLRETSEALSETKRKLDLCLLEKSRGG